ncbi:MAG: hypothetical protein WA723_17880 [Pseudolabrys sp.]
MEVSQCPLRVSEHICSAKEKEHVRFAPNSDRESGLSQPVMSALPPKADIEWRLCDVCFVPIADIFSRVTNINVAARLLYKSSRAVIAGLCHAFNRTALAD